MRALVAMSLVMGLAGCVTAPEPVVPMPLIAQPEGAVRGDRALVLLPGIRDRARSFEREGFFDGPSVGGDLFAADAHFGYYRDRSVVQRLYEDVLRPLRADGYREIWLVGVSLGGFGAIHTAIEHPGLVDGMVLLAPYVADEALAREIEAAGGLATWEPGEIGPEDYERQAMAWLRERPSRDGAPELFLGFGAQDRFAPMLAKLEPLVEEGRFVVVPGGHDWATWRTLWRDIARRRFVPSDTATAGPVVP